MTAPAHTLIVAHDLGLPDAELTYRIDCGGVTEACRTWQECLESECDRKALEEAEFDGDDEPEAHGVVHRNVGNLGWLTEVPGCVLRLYDWIDSARDLKLPVGSYPFHPVWDYDGEYFDIKLEDPR